MNIKEKVKRYKKHYRAGSLEQKRRLENILKSDIDSSENPAALWASLLFNGDIKLQTFGERKALKTATNHKITCYTIEGEAIFLVDK
jgi:hypothetical protein